MFTFDAIEAFLTYLVAKGRAPRTVKEYRKRFIVFRSLPTELEKIQPGDIDKLVSDLRSKELASATIATYVQTIRTYFKFCLRRGFIKIDPAADLSRPKVQQSARKKAIRQEDLEKLILQARREEATLELAVLLVLADTGCRAGELLAMNLTDLDLCKFEAVTNGKTGERMIDFTIPTERILCEWIKQRPDTDKDAIFTTKKGRMTYDQLYCLLRDLAARAKVKRFNPQSIRHRVGQGWIDAGANLELVRIKLGHKHISTTSQFYANQDRPRAKAASKKYSLIRRL